MEDCTSLLRVLARSATGQDFSVYTTFSTGARRPGDLDGPEEYHVVLVDNGRSAMIGTEFQDMLRCIRCAACMNHCPVYGAVGGHAYGWVYPGPMGAVLTPGLIGVKQAGHLPNASTFCGKCESVCPVRIPLPKLMRHWREREFERHLTPAAVRWNLGVWGFFARRPVLYRLVDPRGGGGTGLVGAQARPVRADAAGGRLDRRRAICRRPKATRSSPVMRANSGRGRCLMSKASDPDRDPPRPAARCHCPRIRRRCCAAGWTQHPRHLIPARSPVAACANRSICSCSNVEKEFGSVARVAGR